ncbi:competence/damage-inducible protein A [Tepidibacillus fermentans]|uniref:Putative competence-damage inducible protein n=1 Tax=Tepidibacillus fermentans TaxID=1281767 RepID=A0A4R3KI66_9BACI|nr:competence/damage-inducible protein A [Tepidibacillus fermentans]TCS83021.1 competence/damage-inducible protein cinA [Tepidibacillus fermentans]
MLKGEIIAVGTELLLGQIANTNAQYISRKMAEIGVPIYYHVSVGDNEERLKQAILQAQKRSNLIIFTGGLGPTQDDLTKETAAKVLNRRLVLDLPSFTKIVSFFKQRQIEMTENNKKQAMVLEGSMVFPNDHGLAAGIGLESDERYYVFLPGPPSEMKPMLIHYVIPWIQKIDRGNIFYSKVMRFYGIGESALEECIIDLIENQTNPTIAPLANDGEVTLRLTAHAKTEEEALAFILPVEEEIHHRLEPFHFGYGNEEIEYVVFRLLEQLQLTVSVSESCTGGLIGSQFTKIPGSSKVYYGGIICYTNEIKHKILHVPNEILDMKGAVSKETAQILSEETLKLFDTDLAVSITGIAGPESVENKPVGLIYIGISEKGKETMVKEIRLSGSRQAIQRRAAKYVHYYLWQILKDRVNQV